MKFSKYNIINKENDNEYLVYNSVSKASMIIDENFKNKYFDKECLNGLSRAELEILKQNNFIIDDNRDEFSELEYMFNQNYFNKDPLNIVLVPTLACNFSCPYCFEKVACEKYVGTNYFEILKKYAEKNFKHHALVQISLFGGEPLLMADKMLDFLDFVKKDSIKNNYELKTSIVTNGSLLTEEIINKLIEYGLFSLQITLDGDKNTHDKTRYFRDKTGSFDLLINKIKMVIKLTENVQNFLFNLRINLNNNSNNDLVNILNNFTPEERKRIRLQIRVIYNTDKYKKDNTNSLDALKEYYKIAIDMGATLVKNTYYYQVCEGCADSRFFYLMPDLSMWKCINDLNFKEANIGKINNDGSVSINFENITNWYKSANCFSDPKCASCKKLPDCFGGCVLHKRKKGNRSCKTFDMACLPYCMR